MLIGLPFWVTVAATSMTPPANLPLGGYTARGSAKGHPDEDLTARLVLFEQGSTKVAVVSFEALTIPDSLAREVRKHIPEDVHLFLVATHTHSAPDSQMLNDRMTLSIPGIANYQRKWLDWTADRIGGLVRMGTLGNGRETSSLGLVTSYAKDMNSNRRHGSVPSGRLSELLFGDTPDGMPLLATFSAHATILDEHNLGYSGDWPGELERQTNVAFLPAAIGDVSPAAGPGKAGIKDYVFKIETSLAGGLRSPVAPILDFTTAPIPLDKPVPHPTFAQVYKVPEVMAQMAVTKFAPTKAEVSVVRLGNLAIVGVPGEPSADLGRRIEALGPKNGFSTVWVVSHVNGWIGYILEPADYDRGGYEATLSLHGRKTADRVVDACNTALAKLNLGAPASAGSGSSG